MKKTLWVFTDAAPLPLGSAHICIFYNVQNGAGDPNRAPCSACRSSVGGPTYQEPHPNKSKHGPISENCALLLPKTLLASISYYNLLVG